MYVPVLNEQIKYVLEQQDDGGQYVDVYVHAGL